MTRKEICIKAWENGELRQDIFGQLATHNFSIKIVIHAAVCGWITEEFAEKLIEANK